MLHEGGADLHVHSHFSDGQDSPARLLERASRTLALISICDHDTLAAYDHLPPHETVQVLPGIEVTACHDGEVLHILGYFPHGLTPGLRDHARGWEADRRERVQRGVRRLREAGVALRWKLLEDCVGEGVPCRSHVARALVRMGMGRSPHGLYARYLTAERFGLPRATVTGAIHAIRDQGGIAVWAHPDLAHVSRFGDALVTAGLQGLEVHGRHRRGDRVEALTGFQTRHGLLATGGSDYHATGRNFTLGRFRLPMSAVPRELWSRDS